MTYDFKTLGIMYLAFHFYILMLCICPPPPPPFSFPCLPIAVRLNSKLAEELGSAKKEIEVLKGRLKELEVKEHDRPVSIESKQNTFAQTKAL